MGHLFISSGSLATLPSIAKISPQEVGPSGRVAGMSHTFCQEPRMQYVLLVMNLYNLESSY